MYRFICMVLLFPVLGLQSGIAADKPASQKKQTPFDLYLTAVEADSMKKASGDKVFFVDIRSPAEVTFVGIADNIDANIPFLLPDFSQWDEKKKSWKMKPNPEFAGKVETRLRQAGLGKASPVILICRSGKRSAKAAKLLHAMGYKRVYTVIDGFEGDKAKTGPQKGKRIVNGWKNSGLAWSYKLKKDVVYQ